MYLQLSQKTRVLVQPQSRYRKYSWEGRMSYYEGNYWDALMDFEESAFLYYLHKQRQQHPAVASWTEEGKTSYVPFGTGKEDLSYHHPSPQGQPKKDVRNTRDHLVIDESGGGVWWWDTSLPLNLASINECEQLHQQGFQLDPIFLNTLLNCIDSFHAGFITLRDQATMLINLICNSLLDSPGTACCN